MLSNSLAEWKRTMLSVLAAAAATLAPAAARADAPHGTKGHDARPSDDDERPDADGKKSDPKHAKATKRSVSASASVKVAPEVSKKKVEAKAAVKAPRVHVKAEVEPKVHVKAEVEPKVHAKAEVKVDPKVHVKAEVEPRVHVKAEVAPKAHAKVAVVKVAPRVHVKAEVEPKVHAKVDVVEVEPKVHVKAEVAPKAHAKVDVVEVEPRVHVKTEVAPKAHAKVDVVEVEPKTAKVRAPAVVDEIHLDRRTIAGLKKTKTVASRSASGKLPGRRVEVEQKPCNGAYVTVDRGGLESEKMPLVDCKGRPLGSAREKLSVLVRPWGAARPKIAAHEGLPKADSRGEIAPGVRLLDSGLLTRLDAIARHFPGKSFSFVSGYRPQSRGSNHQSGRAVDVRLVGVSNEALVATCRTLKDTGCGYYPNSSFIHVDVRNPGTGSVTWIDSSGPGEAPRYVPSWPPPKVYGTDPANREERLAPPLNEEPHDDITSEQLPRLGEVPEHPLL